MRASATYLNAPTAARIRTDTVTSAACGMVAENYRYDIAQAAASTQPPRRIHQDGLHQAICPLTRPTSAYASHHRHARLAVRFPGMTLIQSSNRFQPPALLVTVFSGAASVPL
jgi:hypothetical protein